MDYIYLDQAATTQKPQVVIDSQFEYYTKSNANVHRGNYSLAVEATELYEQARKRVADFIGSSAYEIIFTKGATESLNFLASSLGQGLNSGDEILLTEMEHHANLIPWQILAKQKGLILKYIPVSENGELDLNSLDSLITEKTKIVSFVHISNVLGTINTVREIADKAHKVGAKVILDVSQSISHLELDVNKLDVDYLVFSGHKVFAPMGIGVLFGKQEQLVNLPVYQGGGEMINTVSFTDFTLADIPHRFEAGTPNVAGAIGLGVALEWLKEQRKQAENGIQVDFKYNSLGSYESFLLNYTTQQLLEINGLKIFGLSENKAPIISFTIAGIHPLDLASYLDNFRICLRVGQHCAQPLHQKFGLENGTLRISLNFTNTVEEIDFTVEKIKKGLEVLKG